MATKKATTETNKTATKNAENKQPTTTQDSTQNTTPKKSNATKKVEVTHKAFKARSGRILTLPLKTFEVKNNKSVEIDNPQIKDFESKPSDYTPATKGDIERHLQVTGKVDKLEETLAKVGL